MEKDHKGIKTHTGFRASREECIKITASLVVKLFNLEDVSDVSEEYVDPFSEWKNIFLFRKWRQLVPSKHQ
jgi:hypothetical protein